MMNFVRWVMQDWEVNAGRREVQFLLAWFRIAQWANQHLGVVSPVIGVPYWTITSLLFSFEFPATAEVGPRLRLYHPHGIVLHPYCSLGSDCELRHGVTVGSVSGRDGIQRGPARVGDKVDFGAGCVVLGDVTVGDHARLGALAVVVKSVPAWGVVAGNPARLIRVDEPQ